MAELTEEDIPGAVLCEPLEAATVHSLKWWLLCRGIQCPSSWKKAQLIDWYVKTVSYYASYPIKFFVSVRKSKLAGTKVVDVDGSYTYRKRLSAGADVDSDATTLPDIPLIGWDSISGIHSKNADQIPIVTHGKISSCSYR